MPDPFLGKVVSFLYYRNMLVAMVCTFLLVMLGIHEAIKYFVALNVYITFFLGFGILISIAVYVDRKNGVY